MRINNVEPLLGLGKLVTDNFSGDAWVKYLSTQIDTTDCLIYNVTFSPSARNYWHKHSEGQIIICTEGMGYYQEKGKSPQRLNVGDILNIPAHVEHWHGASPNNYFTHIGITPKATINKVEWIRAVSDEEFNKVVF